jgi:hypothetical protein
MVRQSITNDGDNNIEVVDRRSSKETASKPESVVRRRSTGGKELGATTNIDLLNASPDKHSFLEPFAF